MESCTSWTVQISVSNELLKTPRNIKLSWKAKFGHPVYFYRDRVSKETRVILTENEFREN